VLVMRRLLLGTGAVLAACAAVIVLGGRESNAPSKAAPIAPSKAAGRVEAHAPAVARRATPGVTLRAPSAPSGSPGALALRAQADDFIEQQGDAVREHMARERLTLDETRELTYFGILAVQSQDWQRVEQLTGAPLSDDARRQTWEAMMARSQEMRRELQEQIARGDGEDARWDTIARIEDGYLEDYFRITGMTPAMLDALLAAAVREQRAATTIAGLAPDAEPPRPPGATWVRRDPANPDRAPVPVDQPDPVER
jgi:hypothetical protein